MSKKNAATTLWESYRDRVYGKEALGQNQERETSLAFYAGMEATFKMMDKILDAELSEEASASLMETFREEAHAAALHANLDRSTGDS